MKEKTVNPSKNTAKVFLNRLKTFLGKPQNTILVIMAIVTTITTIAPIIAILQDTIKVHPGSIDAYLSGKTDGYTFVNYVDLFTGSLAKKNLWATKLPYRPRS